MYHIINTFIIRNIEKPSDDFELVTHYFEINSYYNDLKHHFMAFAESVSKQTSEFMITVSL